MPKPIVMALDLSTKCGWAVGRDGVAPEYGVWHLGPMSNLGRCFSCLAGSMQAAIADYGVDEVVVEAPLPQQPGDSQNLALLLIGLCAVAFMIAYESELPPVTKIMPSQARKLVLGKGHAKKDHVMAWCKDRGWNPVDDNCADALLLLRCKHLMGRMRIMAGAGSV